MNQTQTQHITLTPFDTGPRSRLAMTVDRDAAAEALIHDGRRAYASKHYKNALECFTRVRALPPCLAAPTRCHTL